MTRYGLPATAQTTIRKVFEARLSAKIRLIYELRDDLQRTYLLAYLSAGRARFFRWLIAEGREQHDLSDASIWWFLIECDEDPARELVRSYKISPWWQRFFPDALTPVGWDRFAGWLKCRHGIDAGGLDYPIHSGLGPWKSSVWRTDAEESGNGGSRMLFKVPPAPKAWSTGSANMREPPTLGLPIGCPESRPPSRSAGSRGRE